METLSGKARRQLRALGHHLKPVVLVGKEGISPALVQALGTALVDHELVKVKLGENAEGDRHGLADQLGLATKAHLVGLIGRTLLLYKPHPDEPKIELAEKGRRVAKITRAPKPAATVKGTAPRVSKL